MLTALLTALLRPFAGQPAGVVLFLFALVCALLGVAVIVAGDAVRWRLLYEREAGVHSVTREHLAHWRSEAQRVASELVEAQRALARERAGKPRA
jgi:hypothetical protein